MASGDLDAGEFSSWLGEIGVVLRGDGGAEVPCGSCNSCCKSSQFIHIEPDERAALARIPKKLLFPAPGLAKGHVLLGYNEQGHCPMLKNDACSIYEERPRTCRAYDCRVFPAAGLTLEDEDKPLIDLQTRRWRFSYADDDSRTAHEATKHAATFLNEHRDELAQNVVPRNPTQLAALAIQLHGLFLSTTPPNLTQVQEVLTGL